jgi:hypothetical protein
MARGLPTSPAAFKFITKPQILVPETFILHSEPFDPVISTAEATAIAAESGRDTYEKAGDKNTQRKSRQKRQHPQKKTLGTHVSS